MRRKKTLRAPKGFFANPSRGLYANIHAKRRRIAAGSGERMRRPGSRGAPTAKAFRDSARTRSYSANPRVYRVLERRPSASTWSPLGAFPNRGRALQYARAYHKAASSPVAVKVMTG